AHQLDMIRPQPQLAAFVIPAGPSAHSGGWLPSSLWAWWGSVPWRASRQSGASESRRISGAGQQKLSQHPPPPPPSLFLFFFFFPPLLSLFLSLLSALQRLSLSQLCL